MKIQPIVEGDGEVNAVPALLRRLRDLAKAYPLDVNPPIRRSRTDLVREDGIRKAVHVARKQQDCAAILSKPVDQPALTARFDMATAY